MTASILIGFACIISGWAIYKKETVIAIIASAIWLAVIAYTRSHPLGAMVVGDISDTAILLALIGLMVLVPVISFRLSKREKVKESRDEEDRQARLPKKRASLRETSSTKTQKENSDEYYDRLHGLTHPRR